MCVGCLPAKEAFEPINEYTTTIEGNLLHHDLIQFPGSPLKRGVCKGAAHEPCGSKMRGRLDGLPHLHSGFSPSNEGCGPRIDTRLLEDLSCSQHNGDVMPNTKTFLRTVAPKKHRLLLFNEVCIPVSGLPTYGDSIEILHQAFVAILHVRSAGWHHRNISTGNILTLKGKIDAEWQVRLSDLEDAERSPSQGYAKQDCHAESFHREMRLLRLKAGSPYFMAYEIQFGIPLAPLKVGPRKKWRDFGKPVDDDPVAKAALVESAKVVHTLQHDLESLWWIGLYLGAMKVGNRASEHWCIKKRIFCDYIQWDALAMRHELFKYGFPKGLREAFHPSLRNFMRLWDGIRLELVVEYTERIAEERNNLESYAKICEEFAWYFEDLLRQSHRAEWGHVPLATVEHPPLLTPN
ncbi:hypothetical protein DFP72DRAFT_1170065 [Ephemerocybe angulata]|uniref:Fungal-type protein kinase domain-containing protein n=1 Tax=Ephemerocybe angulata TaxID=980116 RepID=A0A8H6HXJ5_9AGAR|nr:hypothetical protein DFP72DRAFT_1170065 [Tulosesus angulatus]